MVYMPAASLRFVLVSLLARDALKEKRAPTNASPARGVAKTSLTIIPKQRSKHTVETGLKMIDRGGSPSF